MIIQMLMMLYLIDPSPQQVVDLSAQGLFGDPPFAISESGRIAVADVRGGRIIVYGPDGAYERTIGQPGQGPGEFQRPILISWNTQEKVFIVVDQRNARFSKWRENGELVKEYSRPRGLYGVSFLDGETLIGGWDAAGRMGRPRLERNDLKFKKKDVLWLKKLDEKPKVYRISIGGARFMYAPTWSERLMFDVGEDFIAVAYGSEDKVHLIDMQGEALRTPFKPEIPTYPMTDKQFQDEIDEQPPHRRAAIREQVKKPEYWPTIRGLRTDEKNRLWIFGAPDTDDGQHPYIIVDRQGESIKTGKIPAIPRLIEKGHLYYTLDTERQTLLMKMPIGD